MAKQERIEKKAQEQKPAETQHAEAPAERDTDVEEILDYTDDLIDEIDGLLEDQEVLTNYRQKGGE